MKAKSKEKKTGITYKKKLLFMYKAFRRSIVTYKSLWREKKTKVNKKEIEKKINCKAQKVERKGEE